MKFKLILIFLLFNISAAFAADSSTDISSDSFFDDLEEQAVKINSFDSVEHKPIHPLMVWMRIIGSPIISAYFSGSQTVQNSWHWLIAHLTKKVAKSHDAVPQSL